jgi:hypothetical protein
MPEHSSVLEQVARRDEDDKSRNIELACSHFRKNARLAADQKVVVKLVNDTGMDEAAHEETHN